MRPANFRFWHAHARSASGRIDFKPHPVSVAPAVDLKRCSTERPQCYPPRDLREDGCDGASSSRLSAARRRGRWRRARSRSRGGFTASVLGEEYTHYKYNIPPYYFDLSAEFPEGFGYGLIYYDTGLDSSVPDDVIKAALEGAKRPAQIDPAKLKELWGYGRQ
jgi:hypothetical protein